MTNDAPVIEWHDVGRRFRRISGADVVALSGFSLSVPRGSVFGLLGRNGCGKTTALRVALGLARPDVGRSLVFGENSTNLSPEVRRRIGYLTEAPFEYDDLPMARLLRFVSAFFPAWDASYVEALRDRMKIPADQTLSEMSFGVRRRAELFVALASRPELLVLDDPWLGVDAVARRDFLTSALDAAREDGVTILFTSHVLTDVERVADRVAIMREGRILWTGELDALKARCKKVVVELRSGVDPRSIVVPGEIRRTVADGAVVATTGAFDSACVAALRDEGATVTVEDLNLESAFVELTADDATATEAHDARAAERAST